MAKSDQQRAEDLLQSIILKHSKQSLEQPKENIFSRLLMATIS